MLERPVLWCYSGQGLGDTSDRGMGKDSTLLWGGTCVHFIYGKSLAEVRVSATVRDRVKKKRSSGVSAERGGAEELPKSQGSCCVSCGPVP